MRDVTSFQDRCRVAVLSALHDLGFKPVFEVHGENETYLKATAQTARFRYEIFIYQDEAGFFQDGQWSIWESQDFRSPEELIEAFVLGLSAAMRQ